MNDHPVCSVIIPSYCSASTIDACLHSLLAQNFSQPYEIIVVDSSPEGAAVRLRAEYPQVQVIHYPQRTDPAKARNRGAQAARGQTLAFIDADCSAQSDWLRRLYATLQEGYQAAGGAILNGNPDSPVSWAGYLCEFREFLPRGNPRQVRNLTLGNAAYQKEAFWRAGGFPQGYFPQEDQVFHHAFCRHGARIRFDPRILVSHHHRTERRDFLEHQRRIGQVNARVVRRLGLAGAALARSRRLALIALPALVTLRFMRTLQAGWQVEDGLLLRQPEALWLCWLGMAWWGRGFSEGAGNSRRPRQQYAHPGN